MPVIKIRGGFIAGTEALMLVRPLGAKNEFVHEVKRSNGTQGIGYSHFSLGPLAMVAQIAHGRGIELFDYVAPNGRTMKTAWHQLAAWTAQPDTFPYIKPRDVAKMQNVTTTDFDFFEREKTGLFPIRMGYFELLHARWPEPAAAEVLAKIGPHGLDAASMPWLGLTHSAPAQKP